jgi:hypothetical protein
MEHWTTLLLLYAGARTSGRALSWGISKSSRSVCATLAMGGSVLKPMSRFG